MKFIIGKKIGMTQIWQEDKVLAVTKVQAGPCVVTQVKNNEKDKYEAIQLGFDLKKEKNIRKPQLGHLKKLKSVNDQVDTNIRTLKEFRIEGENKLELGDLIKVDSFEKGDSINVVGTSKGKGFQGVVKRHGFHGSKKTHGNKDQERMPGSIGATGPAHVFKGMKMGGRMGGDRVTVTNLEVIDINIENNEIFIKGALPGAPNGLILIYGPGELKIEKPAAIKEVSKKEDVDVKDAEIKEQDMETKGEVSETKEESK